MSKVYVLGGAQTDFERNWSREGKNPVAMLREVLSDGQKNTGISFDTIRSLNEEGRVSLFVGSYLSELFNDQSNVAALLSQVNPALAGVPAVRVEAASASGAAALDAAVTKISAGEADVAVVVGWALQSTVKPDVAASYYARGTYYEKEAKGAESVPNVYGGLLDAYLAKGADEARTLKALAHLTQLAYENGKRSPYALTRKLFMSGEQANLRGSATNPLTAGKLAAADAAAAADGAAVVILVSEKYKAEHCADASLAVVKGRGVRTAPLTVSAKLADAKGEHLLPWAQKAASAAYQSAGLSADDIGVFELYDSFTAGVLASLSSVGLCKPGEEADLIESGALDFGGAKPINPTGGLIGGGHAQSASGVRMFLDLAKQVTGTAGDCQVAGVKNGLMLNLGGAATANYAFILGAE